MKEEGAVGGAALGKSGCQLSRLLAGCWLGPVAMEKHSYRLC